MGFKQRGGDVAVTIIGNRDGNDLRREVRKRWKPDATVITDELGSYKGLDEHCQQPRKVEPPPPAPIRRRKRVFPQRPFTELEPDWP